MPAKRAKRWEEARRGFSLRINNIFRYEVNPILGLFLFVGAAMAEVATSRKGFFIHRPIDINGFRGYDAGGRQRRLSVLGHQNLAGGYDSGRGKLWRADYLPGWCNQCERYAPLGFWRVSLSSISSAYPRRYSHGQRKTLPRRAKVSPTIKLPIAPGWRPFYRGCIVIVNKRT